ncbi:PREDICTED: KH domain-containing, RNA-binding, signal transduction-associated protein 2-like [Amphimedon queenslandica]|uniref:K Homology domain-containing protein n=1 Tax=Amphimedon queenslandica TaxID=400682 RepID=A0A1X7VNH3_AMPQE|nr:PREDICTED: KH domain-containing, RNA-binding, signal transduction-associated protein 2-like [Amphimedon queenslandica]XP_019861900.1 PREDICTED: KH domain-containing, RNA-binding, signal transduction-associated protein 2-like [Amphimedon queenslandica]|eukprot:XP_003383496.1 PREDICTED: KH domain-containing, RNA-binding, signal transduction-associated protein 2-like [Amphimedon queenslandica]
MASDNENIHVDVEAFSEPNQQMSVGRNILEELKAEKNALDPSFCHCIRLLEAEINRLADRNDPDKSLKEKIYIPIEDQKNYNLVGRLLGPKGLTLKRIQAETDTKISILGRGSIKDKSKEEEYRNSGKEMYAHLTDELHVLIESIPPNAVQKLAAGIAEVRKMLIPPEPGQPDFPPSKYDMSSSPYGISRGGPGYRWESMFRPPPPHRFGGRGRPRGMRGRPMKDERRASGGPSHPPPAGEGAPSWRDETPSNDQWRDGTISTDYNHGVMSGTGSAPPGPGGGYSNDVKPFSAPPPQAANHEGFFSDFADTSDSRNGHEWKAGYPSASTRRDYRYHPYDNAQAPPTEGGFY